MVRKKDRKGKDVLRGGRRDWIRNLELWQLLVAIAAMIVACVFGVLMLPPVAIRFFPPAPTITVPPTITPTLIPTVAPLSPTSTRIPPIATAIPPTPIPTSAAGRVPSTFASGDRIVREKDGAKMVFVPGGEFWMGSHLLSDRESPAHLVHVSGFWIDTTKVTNGQYGRCVSAGVCRESMCAHNADLNGDTQPVVCVAWYDAVQYASWAGGRLPTEAEWEKAARGTDGREYPWGNGFDQQLCNTQESGIDTTTPVGTYSPQGDSPYGVADMAGNVCEWTSSQFRAYPYDAEDGREDLEAVEYRVVRGGSFSAHHNMARCAYRFGHMLDPQHGYTTVGSRVVISPDSAQ